MGQSLAEFINSKVGDPALRDEILAEIRWRGMDRAHGLIFEDSVEELDTPTRKPQVGHRVQFRRSLKDKSRFQVTAVDGDKVTVIPMAPTADKRGWVVVDGADEQVFDSNDLMTVATHIEKVFPGLVSAGSVGPATDAPSHIAIRGENLHALRALGYSHAASVDLIYIDPPYNTGEKDWIYNDKRIDANDGYRHSKWLAFMHRRLELARDLLKDTGVIVVAIGDDEHHRLRMLMDEVFGESNFIANICWQGSGSALSNHHAGGLDYMLIYARNEGLVGKMLDPKPHAPQMLAVVDQVRVEGGTVEEAESRLRAYIKDHKKEIAPGLRGFNCVDSQWRVFDTADLTNRLYRPNLKYQVTDPETGHVYDPPDNGWAVEKKVMAEYQAQDLLSYGGKYPRKKKSLADYMSEMPLPSFTKARSAGSAHLKRVLGETRFPNPKDHEVLARWFRMLASDQAVVLDFFGGSGSTLEAVLRLNEEDGGSRQCIITTSNELGSATETKNVHAGLGPGDDEWEACGVYEHVLRPRIETIITGKRADGSTYDGALAGDHRVEFFTLDYMDDSGGLDTYIDYDLMAPLLWARAGGVGPIPLRPKPGEAVVGERFAILFDVDGVALLGDQLSGKPQVATVFIVASSEHAYEQAASDLANRLSHEIRPIHLERTYLDSRTWIPRDRRRKAAR